MPVSVMCRYVNVAVIESKDKPRVIRDTKTQRVIAVEKRLYAGGKESAKWKAIRNFKEQYPSAVLIPD